MFLLAKGIMKRYVHNLVGGGVGSGGESVVCLCVREKRPPTNTVRVQAGDVGVKVVV